MEQPKTLYSHSRMTNNTYLLSELLCQTKLNLVEQQSPEQSEEAGG